MMDDRDREPGRELSGTPAAELLPDPAQNKLGKFLLLAFGLSWAFQVAGSVCAILGVSAAFTVLNAVGMWMPMLAVLLTCKGLSQAKSGIRGWKPRFKGRWGGWLLAITGPALFTLLGIVLYYLVFPAQLDLSARSYLVASVGQQVYDSNFAGVPGPAFLLLTLLQGMTIAGLINTLFAIGEEAGWRGYLYPALKRRFGVAGGRIVGGLIWGAWHWPIIMLTGYEYGQSLFTSPWYMVALAMLAFCVVCVVLGTLMDVVYERSGSIWAAGFVHGSFNAVASAGLYLYNMESGAASNLFLGPLPIGLVAGLPLLVFAAVVLVRDIRREK